MKILRSVNHWLMNMSGLHFDTKQGPSMIYYREKNEEEAGIIKICEYKVDGNVKIFEEKF